MPKIILLTIAAIALYSTSTSAVELKKEDYLSLIVGTYVHGFKEFDTTITSFESSISIGIYYDPTQNKQANANRLATRFRAQIPRILSRYPWAKNVKVTINLYVEKEP